MADKYDIIQSLISQLNSLSDLRGIDKSITVVNMYQNLKALEGIMHDEDNAKEKSDEDANDKT